MLVVAGIAAAAIRWTTDDIPPQGKGPYVFSAAVVDHLPQGFNRVRAALIEELPERPAMLFGPGVNYVESVSRYLQAREGGLTLPDGVVLVDPLPSGTSVRVRDDGRVMLDPAAPVGWDIRSRLVATILGTARDPLSSLTIARCQVLLPSDDPIRPQRCVAGPEAPLVTATADGRWAAAGPIGKVLPTRLVGSTDLSVFTRPQADADRLAPEVERSLREAYGGSGLGGVDLDYSDSRAQVIGDRTLYLIPGTDGETICLHVQEAGAGTAGSCNPRSVLATFGAIPLVGNDVYSAVVGNGYDRVTVPGLGDFAIHDNVFSVPLPDRPVKAITLSGPIGTLRISTFGHR